MVAREDDDRAVAQIARPAAKSAGVDAVLMSDAAPTGHRPIARGVLRREDEADVDHVDTHAIFAEMDLTWNHCPIGQLARIELPLDENLHADFIAEAAAQLSVTGSRAGPVRNLRSRSAWSSCAALTRATRS